VLDKRHAARARRLAFEWLSRASPSARERLIGAMLDDPSIELSREAVARLMEQAALAKRSGKTGEAIEAYRRALEASRDLDQVSECSARLRELGQPADPARQLGYVTHWRLIGPFDNTGRRGYSTAYPPEQEVRFEAAYQGKQGRPAKDAMVRWVDFTSKDDLGMVDFQKPFGEQREVVGYAATEFYCRQRQEVEVRMSSENALKLWINGRLTAECPVYHMGNEPDQYVLRTVLETGRNLILAKVCQNEQTQDWARRWDFRLRVCDAEGKAVLSTVPPKSE